MLLVEKHDCLHDGDFKRYEDMFTRLFEKVESNATQQAETKAFMDQVLRRIDTLETKMITLFAETMKTQNQSEQKTGDRWLEVVKELAKVFIYVVGAILAAKIFLPIGK